MSLLCLMIIGKVSFNEVGLGGFEPTHLADDAVELDAAARDAVALVALSGDGFGVGEAAEALRADGRGFESRLVLVT